MNIASIDFITLDDKALTEAKSLIERTGSKGLSSFYQPIGKFSPEDERKLVPQRGQFVVTPGKGNDTSKPWIAHRSPSDEVVPNVLGKPARHHIIGMELPKESFVLIKARASRDYQPPGDAPKIEAGDERIFYVLNN